MVGLRKRFGEEELQNTGESIALKAIQDSEECEQQVESGNDDKDSVNAPQ